MFASAPALRGYAAVIGSSKSAKRIETMDVRYILGLSVLLQLASAGIALTLIRVTGKRLAWTLIAIAISLMALRRGVSLFRLLGSDQAYPPDEFAELVALAISILMLCGLALIVPLFRATHRAGQSTRESEEKYRNLVETANDLILSVATDGSILFANRAWRETLGFDEKEIRERPVFEIIHPDVRAHCMAQFQQVMQDDRADLVEAVFVAKDGRSIIVEGQCTVTFKDGKPVAVLAIFRDITQRKRAEEALRESEQRYRLLAEATRVVPWEVDASTWQFTYIGPQVAEILGYPAEAWYGPDFWMNHIHPDDRDAAVQFCRAQTADGKHHEFEYRMVKADSEIIWLRDIVSVVSDDSGPVVLRGVFVDISQHKRDEEALRESEQRIHHLLTVSPAGIYSCGCAPDYPTTFVSENAREHLGYDPEEFYADPLFWTKQIHPDDVDRVLKEMARVEHEDRVPHEYRFRHRDGRYIWLHDEITAVRDDTGRLIRVVGSWFDVSERRRAQEDLQEAHDELETRVHSRTADLEQANQRLRREIDERQRAESALRASETRQRVILQSVPMATYVGSVPPEFSLIWISEQVESVCGFPPERFVGRSGFWQDRIHPEDRDPVSQKVKSLLDNATVETEYRWQCADGQYRWFLDRSVLVRDDDGKPQEVIGTWLDITERKLAEQELRESSATLARLLEEQYALLEHTRDFVYRHDTQGVFNYLSPSVEQVTGYSVAEWRKHYTAYMTDHPDNQKVIEYTEETLRSGKESPSYLVEIRHKKGHAMTLEVNERAYFEQGKIAGIVGVARDISDRIRVQRKLKKAKEAAEQANRSKSVFLANVSHEIRTPLTAILGAAELLTLDQDAGGHSNMIVRNGRHLLALIDDLLDISRAEAGRLEIDRCSTTLPDIIADVLAVVEPLYERPEVEFRVCFDTPIPVAVETDPTRLKQALINLISNALKFTHCGRVTVHMAVHPDQAEPRLCIRVEDTGAGIPIHQTERIFESFARIGETQDGVSNGVGLGLPLARYIARQLGGDVTVESHENRGTTFTLRATTGPLDNAAWITPDEMIVETKRHPMPLESTSPLRLRGSILLADDFADTRNLIEGFLSDRGATVTAVENGQAAVDAASQQSFDLILMDVRMPVMDGLTATKELRRRGFLMPIIAFTASTMESDRERVLKSGFDDLWTKPLSMSHLAEQVAAYIGDTSCSADPDPANETSGSRFGTDSPRFRAARADFVRHLPERLQRLKSALEAENLPQADEILHQLVGAGGTHGFGEISEKAAELLVGVRNGTVARDSALDPLFDLLRQAEAAVAVNDSDILG
jgi:PAS domain S-box-containing protein